MLATRTGAMLWSCPAMSQCTLSCRARTLQCRGPPGHNTKFVSQHKPLPHTVSRALPVSQRPCAVSLPYRSLATLYHDTKRSPPATIQHLYRDSSTSQARRARVAAGPCTRPVVSWPMLAVWWGRVVRSPNRVVAPCCTPQRPVSRYSPLYRD